MRLALRSRRESKALTRIEPVMPAAVEEVEVRADTPLSEALERLVALVQAEGVHAAADLLERDPEALPGLARCVIGAQRATLKSTWELAQCPSTDDKYGRLMERLGLSWCAVRPPFSPWEDNAQEPFDRFRTGCAYHPSGAEMPTILAPIQDEHQNMAGLATWFLKRDWSGLTDLDPKITCMGEVLGHTVRLRPADHRLLVAVDLASAAKAWERSEWPVWLTLTPENLAEYFVPPHSQLGLRVWFDGVTLEPALRAARRLSESYPSMQIEMLTSRGRPWSLQDVEEELGRPTGLLVDASDDAAVCQ